MDHELHLYLQEQNADPDWLERLAEPLRRELLALDVDNVIPLPGTAPPGTRSTTPAVAGALLVTLSQTPDALASVVAVVRRWLAQPSRFPRTVRIEVGGDALELTNATAAEQSRMVDLFVQRHTERRRA